MLGVQCQAVQEPGDPAGRRVVPLEHERVHLSTQVLIRQASSILVLAAQRELQWPQLTQEGTLQSLSGPLSDCIRAPFHL